MEKFYGDKILNIACYAMKISEKLRFMNLNHIIN